MEIRWNKSWTTSGGSSARSFSSVQHLWILPRCGFLPLHPTGGSTLFRHQSTGALSGGGENGPRWPWRTALKAPTCRDWMRRRSCDRVAEGVGSNTLKNLKNQGSSDLWSRGHSRACDRCPPGTCANVASCHPPSWSYFKFQTGLFGEKWQTCTCHINMLLHQKLTIFIHFPLKWSKIAVFKVPPQNKPPSPQNEHKPSPKQKQKILSSNHLRPITVPFELSHI